MENIDTLNIILKFRSLRDNIIGSHINKFIQDKSVLIIKTQIIIRRCFLIFKRRTRFTKKPKTYYTLKNRYINREEQSILVF